MFKSSYETNYESVEGDEMIIIAFIFGGTVGAFTMALFSVSAYERGYELGKQDRETR